MQYDLRYHWQKVNILLLLLLFFSAMLDTKSYENVDFVAYCDLKSSLTDIRSNFDN